MPNEPRKLSKDEKKKFKEWLVSKNAINQCPSCGGKRWAIGDYIVSSMTISDGKSNIGGTLYPTAFVFCRNCFYVMNFLSVPIGLHIGESPEDSSDV